MPLIQQPVFFSLLVDLGDEGAAVNEALHVCFIGIGDVDGFRNTDVTDWCGSGWSADDAVTNRCDGSEGTFRGRNRARQSLDWAIKLHVLSVSVFTSAIEASSGVRRLSPWREWVWFELIR